MSVDFGLKTILLQGVYRSQYVIFYGELVYKSKRIVGKPKFSDQFKTIFKRYEISWI